MDRAISRSKGIDKRNKSFTSNDLRFVPKYNYFIGVLNFKKKISKTFCNIYLYFLITFRSKQI